MRADFLLVYNDRRLIDAAESSTDYRAAVGFCCTLSRCCCLLTTLVGGDVRLTSVRMAIVAKADIYEVDQVAIIYIRTIVISSSVRVCSQLVTSVSAACERSIFTPLPIGCVLA